jgi:pimeloyl-ACP methyl ester carboxylesterase
MSSQLLTLSIAFAIVAALGPLVRTAQTPAKANVVASADGIPIAYDALGEGKTALVFVHGWSCDRSYWSEQVPTFSKGFKVVAIDLAGHGESGLGRKAWTIAAFGEDVAAVVRKLGLPRVVLVGHSMGGDVIVEAARRLLGRVAGLVWVDVYNQLGSPRDPEVIQKVLAPFRANFVDTTRTFVRGMFGENANRALVERIALDMSAAPPDVALGAMESAVSFDREMPGTLKALRLPVIAINADYRPTDAASLERHRVEVVIMRGVGHFPMMEDPQRFNPLLEAAIRKLSR